MAESTSVQSESPLLVQKETETSPPQANKKITSVLIFCVIAATVGSSAQFGFNTGVINSVQVVVRESLNGSINSSLSVSHSFSDTQWAFVVSIFAFGGMLGALPAGLFADLIGRKWAMLANNAVAILGMALESFAVSPYMLIAGRFVAGINSGLNTVLAPLYISEISPFKYRGAMGAFHQFAITLTILLSQILGINIFLGRPDNQFYAWRILLAFPLIFVIIQLAVLPWCPESPKYLFIRKRKKEAAVKALERLCGKQNVSYELQSLQAEYEEKSQSNKSLSVIDFILKPYLRRALIISMALHMSQQITGIGAILSYSTQIFSDAGISNGDIATSIVGLVLLLGTCVAIVLVEYLGRRTLMLYGLGGLAVFFTLVSSAFCFQYAFYSDHKGITAPGVLLVVFTFFITFMFSLGPGTIPWLMVSELFQQEARPFAVSVATIVNWLSNFVVGFIFPFMLKNLKPYPFVIFAFISALFWMFMYALLPETRGKTVDQITEYFKEVTAKKSVKFGIIKDNKLNIEKQ